MLEVSMTANGWDDPPALVVDCNTCVARASDACADCVVSYIVDREPGDAVVFDAAEERALRSLAGAGLLPEPRYRRASG